MSSVTYFIFGLLGFLFGIGFFIAFLMGRLNNRISQRWFNWIERTIIAGIVLGIVGMFQPWNINRYEDGFLLVFASTLAYVVWSHIVPAAEEFD
ncbi:MAG: hypothetical protein GYB65_11480 [Chloroflexi bacterium]|nr:hypothetical protein [Chloroflexota bacterium]